MVPGDHGTTYGGNPLVTAGAEAVLDIFESRHIVEHVRKVGAYLEEKLDGLVKKYDFIAERRGRGLLQGLEIQGRPANDLVLKSLEEGLIVITAGGNVLRFVPPLVITEAHVDEMTEKLERAFSR